MKIENIKPRTLSRNCNKIFTEGDKPNLKTPIEQKLIKKSPLIEKNLQKREYPIQSNMKKEFMKTQMINSNSDYKLTTRKQWLHFDRPEDIQPRINTKHMEVTSENTMNNIIENWIKEIVGSKMILKSPIKGCSDGYNTI